jgi:hypothetical protein
MKLGDQFTRREFERRYRETPDTFKAELIEGRVFVKEPAAFLGMARFRFVGWTGRYAAATPCVLGGVNATIRLDMYNEPQPDAMLLIDPEYGGQAIISADDYVERGPELTGEIFASSVSFDLHTKKAVYRRNGVREYIVWRVLDQAIDWFTLRSGDFEQLPLGPDGILRSEVFPGLWLDPAALLRGDMIRVIQVLDQGLASPEHAAFNANYSRPNQSPHAT